MGNTGNDIGGETRPFTRRETTRYVQLAEALRRRIAEGQWVVGERLPTVAVLAETYGVAKITVRQAMDILAREALVSRSRGRGMHVTAKPPFVRWQNLRADWDSFMHGPGTTRILEEKKAVPLPEGAAEPYATDESFDYLRVVGLRAQNLPVSLREVYVVHDIADDIRRRTAKEAMINILADYASDIVIFNQVHTASSDVAALLNIHPGAPLLIGKHVGVNRDRRVMFIDYPFLRGDHVRFEIHLSRHGRA